MHAPDWFISWLQSHLAGASLAAGGLQCAPSLLPGVRSPFHCRGCPPVDTTPPAGPFVTSCSGSEPPWLSVIAPGIPLPARTGYGVTAATNPALRGHSDCLHTQLLGSLCLDLRTHKWAAAHNGQPDLQSVTRWQLLHTLPQALCKACVTSEYQARCAQVACSGAERARSGEVLSLWLLHTKKPTRCLQLACALNEPSSTFMSHMHVQS